MSNEIAKRQPETLPTLAMDDERLMTVLESSVYPGAKRDSIALVLNYCRAQTLDPLQKPVHIVPMSVRKSGASRDAAYKDAYEWRDVIMPGIGLYRVQAARTGEYAGVDEGVFGADLNEKLDTCQLTFPEWCSVTVYRMVQGQRVGFSSGRVYWRETYSTQSKDTSAPNAMWRKRPRGQLEKCAEALALRRAFPELGAQPTAEEMEGKVIDVTDRGDDHDDERRDRPTRGTVAQPRSNKPSNGGSEANGDEDKHAASDGQVAWLKGKLNGDDGGPTLAECLRHLKRPNLDGLSVAEWKAAKTWLLNPTAAA